MTRFLLQFTISNLSFWQKVSLARFANETKYNTYAIHVLKLEQLIALLVESEQSYEFVQLSVFVDFLQSAVVLVQLPFSGAGNGPLSRIELPPLILT